MTPFSFILLLLAASCPADPDKTIRELQDPNLNVRRIAADRLVEEALTDSGRQVVIKNIPVLAGVVQDKGEDTQVRASVMRAIAVASEPKPIQVKEPVFSGLVKVLLDEDAHELIRGWIAMSLPNLASREAAAAALLSASRSTNGNVRVNAAQQLGRLGLDADKLLAWANEALKDPKPQVRMVAMSVAFELQKNDKRARAIFVKLLKDPDSMVRQSTVQTLALVNLATDKELRSLAEDLTKDADPVVAMTSAVVLMKTSTEPAKYAAIIVKGLGAKDEAVRIAAAMVLALSGKVVDDTGTLVPALKQAVNDRSDRVKVQAAMSLIRLTGDKKTYAKVLDEMKSSENEEARNWSQYYASLIETEAKIERKKQGK